MTTRKHNEFLDVASSDEASDRGYDSDANVAESRGHAVKRRRTADAQGFFGLGSDDEDDEKQEEEEEEKSRADRKGKGRKRSAKKTSPSNESEDDDKEENEDDQAEGTEEKTPTDHNTTVTASTTQPTSLKDKKALKPQGNKKLSKPAKKNKTGVVYLSSLPPYLKPSALKSMLEARNFGPITKVFLAPFVPPAGAKRRGNKRKSYTDGWIEFASKSTARLCAETLNASIVGGRKGSYYHDDVWNMKYLRGFKWADLMEQIQRERSEREGRQRMEDARARRGEKVFLAGVEAGRVVDGMARKNEEKAKRKLDEAGEDEDALERKPAAVRRRFTQNDVVGKEKNDQAIGDDAKRVLGKIF
ncbi:hypothetical protein NUU61_004387 [Penicillium alfredii]|uniref:Pre-rRNA-processing protein ESF2 n=1 Tax=Penicillium alfredii TaxID=1506179 RepID=A0A9W9KD76_9EURO|nr:uncharacterized protein NUU61_004387 [Penicillium alfredii]KAJ5102165.1 hypothetical protein NUU61_004387 [Penicillium alfredii]